MVKKGKNSAFAEIDPRLAASWMEVVGVIFIDRSFQAIMVAVSLLSL
jgi:hypothetical protein